MYQPPTFGNVQIRFSDTYDIRPESDGVDIVLVQNNGDGHGFLSGTVTVESNVVAGARVRAFQTETGAFCGEAFTNHLGFYVIRDLDDGWLYDVVVSEPTGIWEKKVSSRRRPVPPVAPPTIVGTLGAWGTDTYVQQELTVVGGLAPYQNLVVVSGALPGTVDVQLQDDLIQVSGRTGLEPETGNVTISVSDLIGNTATATLSWVVDENLLNLVHDFTEVPGDEADLDLTEVW